MVFEFQVYKYSSGKLSYFGTTGNFKLRHHAHMDHLRKYKKCLEDGIEPSGICSSVKVLINDNYTTEILDTVSHELLDVALKLAREKESYYITTQTCVNTKKSIPKTKEDIAEERKNRYEKKKHERSEKQKEIGDILREEIEVKLSILFEAQNEEYDSFLKAQDEELNRFLDIQERDRLNFINKQEKAMRSLAKDFPDSLKRYFDPPQVVSHKVSTVRSDLQPVVSVGDSPKIKPRIRTDFRDFEQFPEALKELDEIFTTKIMSRDGKPFSDRTIINYCSRLNRISIEYRNRGWDGKHEWLLDPESIIECVDKSTLSSKKDFISVIVTFLRYAEANQEVISKYSKAVSEFKKNNTLTLTP
jgi:hypothetical protein